MNWALRLENLYYYYYTKNVFTIEPDLCSKLLHQLSCRYTFFFLNYNYLLLYFILFSFFLFFSFQICKIKEKK